MKVLFNLILNSKILEKKYTAANFLSENMMKKFPQILTAEQI